MFYPIKNISDVLPYIEGDKSFVILDKGDHIIIDYVIETPSTFPDLLSEDIGHDFVNAFVRRECRGISFDKDTGNLIAIGLQKFFNLNQREETQMSNINWFSHHTVMDKRDGSLIFPRYLKNRTYLGTRKGDTDVAKMAQKFIKESSSGYIGFIEEMRQKKITPFFEFFCKENMIVVDYGQPSLILLCARHMENGSYLSQNELEDISGKYNIPIVNTFDVKLSVNSDFFNTASKEVDKEGYIIRFENGYTIKVKNEWYVNLHRIVSGLNTRKNVCKLILDGTIDDVLPQLPRDRRQNIEEFSMHFWDFYNLFAYKIKSLWIDIKNKSDSSWSRKEWASEIKNVDKDYMYIMFKLLDDDGFDRFNKHIKNHFESRMIRENVFEDFCKKEGFDNCP